MKNVYRVRVGETYKTEATELFIAKNFSEVAQKAVKLASDYDCQVVLIELMGDAK